MNPHAFGNTGYVYKGDDPRNFILEKAQAAPVAIPATYRTDTSALGIYMQSQIPDCVENGVTFVKRYFDWKSDGVNTDRSRRFLAILTAQDDGFPLSEGTNLTNALKRAINTGICESTILADDHTLDLNTFVSAPITQPMLDNAKTSVIQSYAYLSDKSLQGLKNAIYQNGVVILALKLDKNWWTAPNGSISWAKNDLLSDLGHLRPPTDPASTGGHVCVAIGYTENGIIIQNSFGETWCDQGFAMLGSDYMPFIYEAATIIDMTPEQYRNKIANQDINTIDQLNKVKTTQNAALISQLVAQLWQKFLDLFQKPLGLGRWSMAFGGVPRSNEWPRVRAAHIKIEPTCQVCGGNEELNVHHILPFHIDMSLELDPNNLITLCNAKSCHIRFGHFGNFKDKWNPDIRKDAPTWNPRFTAKNMDFWPVDNSIAKPIKDGQY